MAQKFGIGEKVYVRYDCIYKGQIRGYKIEDVGEKVVEMYKVEIYDNIRNKTSMIDVHANNVFGTEEAAANYVLECYNVSERLRFK